LPGSATRSRAVSVTPRPGARLFRVVCCIGRSVLRPRTWFP
jgi:hypothetical protein